MTKEELIEGVTGIIEECRSLKNQLETLNDFFDGGWRPIETFDYRTFCIMSTGIPDGTEVVKYKGEVPEWAVWWRPMPPFIFNDAHQYRT